MFVPYTENGELAKRFREAEKEIGKQTGIKLKIVERTGTKIVDLLHRSDPWQGQDCQREDCLLCDTKNRTEKYMRQECTKRCVVYETWCLNCEEEERKKIEEGGYEENEKREKMRSLRLHKYIGETSRSFFERGLEHLRDLRELKPESHMLRHYFDQHQDEDIEKMKFGGRIVKQARSAFNRQISESVQIQQNAAQHSILNSKSEYNRCALPRLATKLGEIPIEKLEKMRREEKEKEKQKERELMMKIRNLRVKQSFKRREETRRSDQPAEKRRKTGTATHKRVYQDQRTQIKRQEEDPTKEDEKDREEKGNKYYPIFKKKRTENVSQVEEDKEKNRKENEEEKKRMQEETAKQESKEREERIKKANKLEKSWELLRQCRKMLEENGEKWRKSRERRDMERKQQEEKEERIEKARQKEEGWKIIRTQKKITETLL